MEENKRDDLDEELDQIIESVFGCSVEGLRQQRMKKIGAAYLVNLHKLEMVKFCSKAIQKAVRAVGAPLKTDWGQDKLNPTIGYVTIEAPRIEVVDFEWFARAAEFASSTETYALENGDVRMTFTFHWLQERLPDPHSKF